MIRILSILFALLISNSVYGVAAKSTVILLSVDGFSFSYLQKYRPPNLLSFAKHGVSTALLPVYPSKTFPNHLSIITGMHPVNHGIVHNRFYHPTLNNKYHLGAGKKNKTWLTASPFWSIAENNSIKSAVYFWPESETIGYTSPSYNIPYNKSTSNEARLEQLIKWLKLPVDERPYFLASYFSTIDSAGHHYGTDSAELKMAINDFDKLFGDFIERVNKEIAQPVNIIVVSDHGMVPIVENSHIQTSLLFTDINMMSAGITTTYSDTQIFIYFDKNKVNDIARRSIENQLQSNRLINKKRYNLYTKGNYPKHWNFNADLSIVPDIILEAMPPAVFTWKKMSAKFDGATHGFDPEVDSRLEGIFMASGSNIVEGKVIDPFKNIHILPLMSNLLGLKEKTEIDGRLSVLNPIIK